MKKLIFLISLVSFYSCTGKKEVFIPEDILPKEKMTQVMIDVQMLEASLSLNLLQGGVGYGKNSERYAVIFKKHGISGKKYYDSFKFYGNHPGLLEEMYESVLKELNKKLSEEADKK